MSELLYDLILQSARKWPCKEALVHKNVSLCYEALADNLHAVAQGLLNLGLSTNERVAVYLPKQPETVSSLFGASLAGGAFVPVNPLLKPEQVEYILRDCNVRILITSENRAQLLSEALAHCHDLNHVVIVGPTPNGLPKINGAEVLTWDELISQSSDHCIPARIDTDMTAILYTSGSTGRPKGVMLSHRNMVVGAKSVAQYLENTPDDRLLAVLPFSFDYGLSQLTTAFSIGASVVLMDYLLPRDVIRAVAKHGITGLAAVPPLWAQIANLPWPEEAQASLRYITNSGGAMPGPILKALRTALPNTQAVLMYGLTEAFRSTYLPVEELDRRPGSMGRAIPNAEVMVVREDGSLCSPDEPGELVHLGSLVAMGYWNDPERTAELFRPAPGQEVNTSQAEIAVWSGDTVQTDEDGFLYFIGRKDDMIKTSGYRVSPTEVEEIIYTSGLIGHAIALGIPHPTLGQAIVVVVSPADLKDVGIDEEALYKVCREHLPNFMIPAHIHVQQNLPLNPHGKIDRKLLAIGLQDLFQDPS